MSYLGTVEDTGASPYQIKGDPVVALLAQLNRFAGKTVKPGGTCGERRLVGAPFSLQPPIIDDRAATSAVLIVWQRYSCVPLDVWSSRKEKWIAAHLGGDARDFVRSNLNELTVTIAQFGDSLGLDAAKVGITELDPKMKPKFPVMTVVLLGALAIGAVVVTRMKK